MRRQSIDYYHTRSLDGTRSLHPKKTHSSRLQDNKLSVYSGTRPTDGTCSLSRKRISTSTRQQLVDYSENIRLLRHSKKQIKTANIKATSRSAINLKESTIHQNVKSTAMDTRLLKNQEDITMNCLSLWCWLQATDNLISDVLHLRNILREFLLRAANGNPIANKGQVHGREKGLN